LPTVLWGFAACGVAVVGTHAYVTVGGLGLQVIDVTNPASPVIVGGVNTRGYAQGVAVVGSCAYVAEGDHGLQVIDVTNPASPAIVGGVDTPGEGLGIAVMGGYAYVADGSSGLQVVPAQCEGPTAIEEPGPGDVPGAAMLVILSLSPNPFNPSMKVAFENRRLGRVTMDIYDVQGRRVSRVPLGVLMPGPHQAWWDGRDANGSNVPSGVYFVRLRAGAGQSQAVKTVLIR